MGNANGIFSSLGPTLESTLANPQGFSPADEAAMETGAQQSAGGTQAGAVGQGGLLAARTRNAGSTAKAISDASRGAGEQLSQNLLGIRGANAKLKNQQQNTAISGLEGLYNTGVSGGNQALGEVAPLVTANTGAINASYDPFTDIIDPLIAAGGNVGAAQLKNCWIAESIYGVDDPRTLLVRAWLNGPFSETRTGMNVMWLYVAIGRSVAKLVRKYGLLRRIFKPLFDKALAKAQDWDATVRRNS